MDTTLESAGGLLRALARGLAVAWIALAAACASLPQEVERRPSTALADPETTALGRAVATAQPRAGLSGFRLIATGQDALDSRRVLAERAQRTLDLQYYIVRDDPPTHALLTAVRAAAERGVRVRVLIDDMNTAGQDPKLAALGAHPNIELRLFNPFPGERSSLLTRLMASLGDLSRLNRRMHNKAFIADNAVGITGGRNLGAEYFLQDEQMNFADLDVLAAGPAVREMSRMFDHYWNDGQAYPIQALAREEPPATATVVGRRSASAPAVSAAIAAAATAAASNAAANAAGNGPANGAGAAQAGAGSAPRDAALRALLGRFGELSWASAILLADKPAKIEFGADALDEPLIADDLAALLRGARREVILVTPYFVPGDWGLALMQELRARNLRVRVLTNSLAATDVPIVHAGYARYRRQLLEMGVELYELQPTPARGRGMVGVLGSSRASLHAKAAIVDGRVSFIGSLNLDPRSIRLNTEMGLVIDSRPLSAQLVRLFEQSAAPDASFRPRLVDEGRRIEWTGLVGGVEQRFDREPDAGVWRTLVFRVLGPLAPDELL